jgi:tetratricopeptide (TPR) repeat protein
MILPVAISSQMEESLFKSGVSFSGSRRGPHIFVFCWSPSGQRIRTFFYGVVIAGMQPRTWLSALHVTFDTDEIFGGGRLRVFTMENHDQAYNFWRDAGVKNQILVHIDAHHDMWWMDDNSSITIANFICLALKEDLVAEVYWVVPDATWQSSRSRHAVRRHLKEILKKYPIKLPFVETGARISASILGKPLTVCSLSELPMFDRSVLLDIDTDYLVIPRVTYGRCDEHAEVPWCWPEELVERLRLLRLSFDIVTVAYSVEGGYTPLEWKILGEELAVRLEGDSDSETIRGMDLMKQGRYQEAAKLLPRSAAPLYRLAIQGGPEARALYQRALTLDPSYRTPYNNKGIPYFANRQYRKAEQEFLRTLALDPADSYALLGLARIAAVRGEWSRAEYNLRLSLEFVPECVDAWRTLGEVFVGQKRYDEAIDAYEHSLKLTLRGHRPLVASIKTATLGHPHVNDPNHFKIHAAIARLHERKGNLTLALSGYSMSIAAKCDSSAVRLRVAHLYMRRGHWRDSIQHAAIAIRLLPVDAWRSIHKCYRRLGKTLLAFPE